MPRPRKVAAVAVAVGWAVTMSTGPARAELPSGATIIAEITVDDAQGMPDVGFGSVWVVNSSAGTVSRIDPATSRVSATIAVGAGAFGLRTGDGAVWVTNPAANTLTRINPVTDSVVATIPVGTLPIGLAVTPGAVWVANHWAAAGDATGSVMRIDPVTDSVVATIPVGVAPTSGPKFLAAAGGSVWVGVPNLHGVVRISESSNAIQATIPDKGVCSGIVASATAVWVAGGGGPDCAPGVTRVDPDVDPVVDSRINAGGNVSDVAVGDGSIWFTDYRSAFVVRVAADSGAVLSQLKIDGSPNGITVGFGSVWVLDPVHSRVLRLQPT